MQMTYLSKRIIVALVALVMMAAVMVVPDYSHAAVEQYNWTNEFTADGANILVEINTTRNKPGGNLTGRAVFYLPENAETVGIKRDEYDFPGVIEDPAGHYVAADQNAWTFAQTPESYQEWDKESASYDDNSRTFTMAASVLKSLGTSARLRSQTKEGAPYGKNTQVYFDPYKEVTSLAISEEHKTEYKYGEELDKTSTAVTGICSDETEKDLTDYVTFDGFDGKKPGEQTITVSYGKVTTTFTVTVAEPTPTDQVVDKIEALPSDVTTDDKEKIDEARGAYDALTDEEKATFPEAPMAKLEAAEAKLAAAEAEAAKKEAEDKAAAAEKAQKEAEEKAAAAEKAQKEAEEKAAAAEKAQKEAEEKAAAAEKAQKEAEEKAAAAEKAQKEAEEKAAAAEKAQKEAEEKAAAAEKAQKDAKVAKVKIKKAKGAKKKATITWKKVKGAKGYEIIVAKDKKGTKNALTYNVKGNKAKKVIKKLKKGKYYVKVRACKNYNGNTIYGKWSSAKKVKVK